ncbi:PEP-CTERM sorting domain-containing protein [Aquabacterium sp. CECT 9606]|uniref:PEP-CTERM sorting domain-containing protein n=1 Tax=Aquabacterium sp. CECT 9606 TaxID=2845822 RepID=UPI001E3F8C63|nr:PEP-CTERM sorting domain-containing protein [Aquabacterium sp. CECT 9606]CAH0351120.1 hypothetical protein AQB9606_01934 [Aquabacterium sp. CECT 9606]
MRHIVLSSIALAASMLAGVSHAAVAYDNGSIGPSTSWCVSGVNQCGGASWTIADNFTLTTATVLTGFENWNLGAPAIYVSTNWRIWANQPTSLSETIASGNAVATITEDAGFTLASVSGLAVSLNAGSYWIGFNHILSADNPWTYVTSSSGQANAVQLYEGGVNVSGLTDAAFRLHTSAVPEPESVALILAGLAVVGVASRRRAAC